MSQKHEWIVILPDNVNALEKRMSVRQYVYSLATQLLSTSSYILMSRRSHLSNLKPDIDSGFWVMGGATLDEPIKEGTGPKINGSIMLAVAESKEEVLEKLKKDTYWQNGVWDESKVSCTCQLLEWSPGRPVLMYS